MIFPSLFASVLKTTRIIVHTSIFIKYFIDNILTTGQLFAIIESNLRACVLKSLKGKSDETVHLFDRFDDWHIGGSDPGLPCACLTAIFPSGGHH
jgi:hypothetical protein